MPVGMGKPIEEFTTLMASQGPAWATDSDTVVNDVVLNTYTAHRIASNNFREDMVQGGTYITDRILLHADGDWQRYNWNDSFTHALREQGVNWEVPWAMGTASISWCKGTVGLNTHQMGRRYRTQKYKSVMRQLHQELWTHVCEKIDAEYWAQPHYDLMEAATLPAGQSRIPMSIPAAINEFPGGYPIAIVDQGGDPWSTFQKIGAASDPDGNWAPYAVGGGAGSVGAADTTRGYTFDATAATLPWSVANLFSEFERAYWNLRFDRLPKQPQYSDKTSSPQVIWCSYQGLINYEFALRAGQDHFRGVGKTSGQDPAYDGPTYRRMPLEPIPQLGDGLYYSNGTIAVNELNATGTAQAGPRYYFMQTEYVSFVMHEEAACTLDKPKNDRSQPFTWTQQLDLWNNNVFRSRKRHGIVGPRNGSTYVGA